MSKGQPRRRFLLAAALVALLALAAWRIVQLQVAGREEPGIRAVDYPMPSFTATDQVGRTVSAADVRSKIVVASFIYTQCSAECPLISAQMARVQQELDRQGLLGSKVMLLSFSVDPFRDTPQVLEEYAAHFRADPEAWRFLTGPPREWLEVIQQGFKLGVGYVNEQGELFDPFESRPQTYEVIHALNVLLIDRDGMVRKQYIFPEFRLESLIRDVRLAASG